MTKQLTAEQLKQQIDILTKGYEETRSLCEREEKKLKSLMEERKNVEDDYNLILIQKNESIKEKDIALQEKEKFIKEIKDLKIDKDSKQKEINNAYEPIVKEKEDKVQELNNKIKELDDEIARKMEVNRKFVVKEVKQEEIDNLDKNIQEKNDEIKLLTEKKDSLEEINKSKNKLIDNLDVQIKNKKEEIDKLNKEKVDLNEEVMNINKEIDKSKKELEKSLKGSKKIADAIVMLRNKEATVEQTLNFLGFNSNVLQNI